MRGYTQLTQEERYQIYILIKAGHAQSEIAEMLAHHKSTISRELRRNHGLKGYRPKQARRLALSRRRDLFCRGGLWAVTSPVSTPLAPFSGMRSATPRKGVPSHGQRETPYWRDKRGPTFVFRRWINRGVLGK